MNTLELNVFSDQILTIAKDVLTEKQYDVLVSRAIHKVTFKQIGIKYNVSPSRIQQIEAKAHRILIEKLRKLNSWT